MKVVCISGKAQAGKDTIAEMLRKSLHGFGKRVLIIHNADLLKFMCKQIFNWNGEKDDYGRGLLQYVGTDVIRAHDPDFWVNYIRSVLEIFGDSFDYVLVPDCRFPNEIDVLRRSFETIHVRVVRAEHDSGLTDNQKNHPSETSLDCAKTDYTVENTGDLNELYLSAIKLIMAWEPKEHYVY